MLAFLLPLIAAPTSDSVYLFGQHFVMGTYAGGAWKSASKDVLHLAYPVTATGVGIGKLAGATAIPGVEYDDHFEAYFIKGDDAPTGIYLTGKQPTFPRPITTVAKSNPTYLAAVKNKLASMGLKGATAKIVGAYKVDLDGNGTQEVLINASNSTEEDTSSAIDGDPRHKGGDYSMLLLRFIDGKGKVRTQELAANYKNKGGLILILTTLSAIADLDGDGKYEFVTHMAPLRRNGSGDVEVRRQRSQGSRRCRG